MRSKLFVPGTRREVFSKAMASAADGVSFDLEDSVVDNRKVEARGNIAKFIQSPEVEACRKTIIVRSNGIDTAYFEADILAVTLPTLNIINLPKVESSNDIHIAVDAIERAEKHNGINKPVQILANIESAKGLLMAAEIAKSHPRVMGLQLGLNDLFQSLDIDRGDSENIHAAMFAVRMAAGSNNIIAFDGAFADIKDVNGFCSEAEKAFRLGYMGKSCIHPSQISFANDIFSHSDDDVAFAQRVLEESRKAESQGVGAFTVDGKMIDLPIIRRAEAVLESHRRLRDNVTAET